MRRIACLTALLCALSVLLPLSAAANAAASVSSRAGFPVYSRPVALLVSQEVALPEMYQVRAGDTLSRIASREYGSPGLWPDLWWTNRKDISDPNVIAIGERLRISSWHTGKAWTYKRAMAAIPVARPARVATVAAPAASAPAAAPVATVSFTGGSGFEACVIARESGGNPTAVNPTSGAGGLFQFLPSTWAALGFAGAYPGGAQTAPASVQVQAFWKLYAEAGTSPWAPYDGC